MHATSALRAPSALLRRPFWSVAAPLRGGAPRRSAASPGAPPSSGRSRAFRCDAAALTSEDDAALEAEAEKPKRLAQQVRARRAPLERLCRASPSPTSPPRAPLAAAAHAPPTIRFVRGRAARVEPLAPPSR